MWCIPGNKRVCDRLENGKIEIRLGCCEYHCLFYYDADQAVIINKIFFGKQKLYIKDTSSKS